jgi:hypothetical protein
MLYLHTLLLAPLSAIGFNKKPCSLVYMASSLSLSEALQLVRTNRCQPTVASRLGILDENKRDRTFD